MFNYTSNESYCEVLWQSDINLSAFSLLCLIISDVDWSINATDPWITATEQQINGTEYWKGTVFNRCLRVYPNSCFYRYRRNHSDKNCTNLFFSDYIFHFTVEYKVRTICHKNLFIPSLHLPPSIVPPKWMQCWNLRTMFISSISSWIVPPPKHYGR